MKFLGLFRILKRLRDLEAATRELETRPTYESIRPLFHASADRLAALEEVATSTKPLACSRCGGFFENRSRPNGPHLMERTTDGGRNITIACDGCEPYVKRSGWFRVPDRKLATTPIPTESMSVEEVPS